MARPGIRLNGICISSLVACRLAVFGASPSTEAGPLTVAMVERMELPRAAGDGKLEYRPEAVLVPIATYEDGAWISGGRFDGSNTRGFSAPEPTEDEVKTYWQTLLPQTFFGLYDPSVTFRSNAVIYMQGACMETFMHLWGTLSSGPPCENGGLLVWNLSLPSPRPEKLDHLPHAKRILGFVRTSLAAVEAEFRIEPWSEGFDPAQAQGLVVKEVIRFQLDKRHDALWVHIAQDYFERPPVGSEECPRQYTGHFFGVFQATRTGRYRPVWHHSTMDNNIGNIGTFYRFLGAADINSDGTAELILEEYVYECSVYYLYELRRNRFIRAAGALERGV